MKELINEYLTTNEIEHEYSTHEHLESYHFTITIEHGYINGLVAVNNDEHQVMIHLLFPVIIPEEKRRVVSELLCRINYDDLCGAVVMDFQDGSIGYQSGFFTTEGSSDYFNVFENYFSEGISRLDYFMPAVLKVSYGDAEPAQALDELIHKIDPRLN